MADVRNFMSQQNLADYHAEVKKNFGNITVVTTKPSAEEAKEKTLYLVKQTAGNGYDAYIYDGEEVTQVTDAATADLSHKIDKVSGGTTDNFAALTEDGSVKDSGKKAADFEAAGAVDTAKEELNTAIAKKADKATTLAGYGIGDAYTKTQTYTQTETDQKIAEALAAANKITVEVVTETSEVTKENVIYLIKKDTAPGEDKYEEYMYLNEEATKIGDTSTDLSQYYTQSQVDAKFTALATEDSAVAGQYVSSVSQVGGKITVTRATLPDGADVLQDAKDYADSLAENYDEAGAAEAAKTEAKSYTDTQIAAAAKNYATAAQGAKADSAMQPADIAEIDKSVITGLFTA